MGNNYNLIKVPPLHPKQQAVWDVYFSGQYRNFVINAGRRFGKSTACLAIAIEEAVNHGKKVWWVSPTYKLLGNQWRTAKDVLKDVYTSKSEVDRRMEFYYTLKDGTQTRGEINFRSADKPDNLRGDGIHLLIIDEAAFQSLEVYKVLRPATVDTKGNIIFISTPNGHNWFYTFFQRGLPDNQQDHPRWWSKHFTSYDNPMLDPKELEDAKKDMTETEFRVEHMAEFIDDIGKIFSNVRECAVSSFLKAPDIYGQYSIGIDLARKHDATVVSIMDKKSHKQVAVFRFIGLDWDLQKAKLSAIIKLWRPENVYVDATAVGAPVVEDLQKLCPEVTLDPFILTAQSKPVLIQHLAVKLQNHAISILDDQTDIGQLQINELLAYEVRKVSKEGVKIIYAAPRGGKDDTVIALALSIKGIIGEKSKMVSSLNPFYTSVSSNVPKGSPSLRFNDRKKRATEIKRQFLISQGLL